MLRQSAIKVFYDGKTLEIPITEKQENNINNDKESEERQ